MHSGRGQSMPAYYDNQTYGASGPSQPGYYGQYDQARQQSPPQHQAGGYQSQGAGKASAYPVKTLPPEPLPKNSNWNEPIDQALIVHFKEQYIPVNFEKDQEASQLQMLLNDIKAIKDKAKNDENSEFPSRLYQLMNTLKESPPEIK